MENQKKQLKKIGKLMGLDFDFDSISEQAKDSQSDIKIIKKHVLLNSKLLIFITKKLEDK